MNESKEKVTIKVSVAIGNSGAAVVRHVDLERLERYHPAQVSAVLQLEIAAAAAAVAASAGVIAAAVQECSGN